jgi:hypothetical protein
MTWADRSRRGFPLEEPTPGTLVENSASGGTSLEGLSTGGTVITMEENRGRQELTLAHTHSGTVSLSRSDDVSLMSHQIECRSLPPRVF